MSVYQAQVVGHHDYAPLKLCLAVIPQMSGVAPQVVKLPADTQAPPKIGSSVWVMYDGGDISQPVLVGAGSQPRKTVDCGCTDGRDGRNQPTIILVDPHKMPEPKLVGDLALNAKAGNLYAAQRGGPVGILGQKKRSGDDLCLDGLDGLPGTMFEVSHKPPVVTALRDGGDLSLDLITGELYRAHLDNPPPSKTRTTALPCADGRDGTQGTPGTHITASMTPPPARGAGQVGDLVFDHHTGDVYQAG